MSDNLKTAMSRLAVSRVCGCLRGFHAGQHGDHTVVFKIRPWGCCFYSPIGCETVELLFNFIGGGLVRDFVSGLGGLMRRRLKNANTSGEANFSTLQLQTGTDDDM
jgi:hypothetical protein